MQDALTWGALITAGAALIAVIKFWMDIGASTQRASDAGAAAGAAMARAILLSEQLNAYKVEVARDFRDVASTKELAAAEGRFTDAVHGLREDFRGMAERLDKVLIEIVKKTEN